MVPHALPQSLRPFASDGPMTANLAWLDALSNVVLHGDPVSPHGEPTRELLHQTHVVDMAYPVVTVPERKLNYRFMAAEALWMLEGRDDLAPLVAVNPHMAKFSDDGKILAGAYGPRITRQLDYITSTLVDPTTRQATLTTWTENPKPSRDIPCTIAMDFKIRSDHLHMGVFMRSSDIWLGLPYDIFSFTCVAWLVIARMRGLFPRLTPGKLQITAASSHLYARDNPASIPGLPPMLPPAPSALWRSENDLLTSLEALVETRKGDLLRWWE